MQLQMVRAGPNFEKKNIKKIKKANFCLPDKCVELNFLRTQDSNTFKFNMQSKAPGQRLGDSQ